MRRGEVVERFANIGASVQTNNSAEEFAAYIRSEYVRWGEVIKKAGIKAE
jgi:tripartite-type tricarboxylate transporter receptor subunit TctC